MQLYSHIDLLIFIGRGPDYYTDNKLKTNGAIFYVRKFKREDKAYSTRSGFRWSIHHIIHLCCY